MRPVLFHVAGFPVYAYSVFIVVAYLAALAYALGEARRQRLNPTLMVDFSMVMFIAGIVGARLLFVLIDYRIFLDRPLEALKLWNGGFIFYGGLIAATLAAVIFMKRRGLAVGFWSDLLAPSAMISLAAGRIGCFLNGCCYGRIAPDLPWGVVYPPSHPALGLAQYPVHPAQLYESLAALLIFLFLVALIPRKTFPGEIFWLMVLLYAAARFGLEFLRGDPRGNLPIFGLSTSQAIAAATFIVAGGFLLHLRRRARRQARLEPGAPA